MNTKEELKQELEKRGYYNFEILEAEKVGDDEYKARMIIRDNEVTNHIKLNLTNAEFTNREKEIDKLIEEYAGKKNGQEAVELLQLYKDRPKQLLNFLDTSLQEERAGDQVLETLYMDLLHLLK